MRERNFNKELFYFLDKIKNNENFALSRWGDGELKILKNEFIDLRIQKNGEFRYDPQLKIYNKSRKLLNDAYSYKDDNYYVGIACPCCVGQDKYLEMKKMSGQDEEHLTWANIFVNSNYKNFLKYYTEEFKKYTINLVINNKANEKKLEFNSNYVIKVGTDAWYINLNIIDDLKEYISKNNIENEIFLFAAGPLANILVYEMWKYNKNNIYLDIGSVYDVIMGMKATRGYHKNAPTINKVCIW